VFKLRSFVLRAKGLGLRACSGFIIQGFSFQVVRFGF
jgi:hypothetical protein